MKVFSILVLVLYLSSCAYAPETVWLHEPTEALRANVRSYSVEGIGERSLVVIPDLLYLNDGYEPGFRRASFIVVSKDPIDLNFERVSVTNRNTGYTQQFELNRVVEVNRPLHESGYYVAWAAPLLAPENNANYLNATALRVTLWYSLPNGERRQEEFDVGKVSRWRWQTLPV